MVERSRHRFNNRPAQLALCCFGGLLVILGLAGLAGSLSAAPLYIAAGMLFSVRALQSSSIEFREGDVVLRSMIYTRRLGLLELSDVALRTGRSGLMGLNREYLTFTLVDGSIVAFKEFNGPSQQPHSFSEVRAAERLLRSRIHQASEGHTA